MQHATIEKQNGIPIGTKCIKGKYSIIKYLGKGGFGNIYLASCNHSQKKVVLKTEKKEDGRLNTLKHEVNILHFLYKNKCKNIPLIIWFGMASESTLCMAIPYYTASIYDIYGGGGVFASTQNIGVPSMGDEVFSIVCTIGNAIEHIQKCGVIHRDIKPQNIMLKENGEPVLIDFGLSTFYLDENGKHVGWKNISEIIGSSKYVSFNVHKHKITPSRRDDYMSLFYVALFMYYGQSFMSQIWDIILASEPDAGMEYGRKLTIDRIQIECKKRENIMRFMYMKSGRNGGVDGDVGDGVAGNMETWLDKMCGWVYGLKYEDKPNWKVHIQKQQMNM